ncbi:MAG TPA: RNA ligase (ATP) [Bellilinea sp.]|nr:RNA ligase (ATP) [Bellilinea sp.]
MSTLIVPVTSISKIRPHPGADRLEIAEVLGWQVVIPKGQYREGQKVVYVPPDAVLPQTLSDALGVTKYLANGRVLTARLRGEPSFGFVIDPMDNWDFGENVAEQLGITKYEPPLRPQVSGSLPDHPLFVSYTEIENLRNFPNIIKEGEMVSVTEKIHGTNCRVGVIDGEAMAGSMRVRFERPENTGTHLYWFPWNLASVNLLLTELGRSYRQVILFGEVFGKVQSFHYGLPNGLDFVAFDLMIEGKYVDYHIFKAFMDAYEVPMVPVLVERKFDLEIIKNLSGGYTRLRRGLTKVDQIREGVVVRPLKERTDPVVGRVILKYLSDDYLLSKHSDYKE